MLLFRALPLSFLRTKLENWSRDLSRLLTAVARGMRGGSLWRFRPDGNTPVNTVDEASYYVKCKFFFSFVIFPSPMLVSCNMHFLTTRKKLPSFTRAHHSPRFWRNLSFQRITLIGTCFLPSLVDDFPVNCYTRSGGIKLTTTQSTFSLEHVELVDTALDWVQYVVLGPQLKIILNILPESERNELKYAPNLAFMFLSIVVKWQVPNLSILLVIRKKVTVLDGPWSATRESTWECDNSLRKRNHHNISCISIFLFLIQSCYKLILSVVKKLLKTLHVFEILRKQFL